MPCSRALVWVSSRRAGLWGLAVEHQLKNSLLFFPQVPCVFYKDSWSSSEEQQEMECPLLVLKENCTTDKTSMKR